MLPVNQPNLANVFGEYSMYPVTSALEQEAQANRNNQINQDAALAEALYKQQQRPLDLAQTQEVTKGQQLTNQLTQQKIDEALKGTQFKHLGEVGTALEQLGAIARDNGGNIPLWLQSQVPKDIAPMFAEEGGWQKALQVGKAIRENSPAWQKEQDVQSHKIEIQNLKGEVERYKADQRRAAMADAAAMRERIAKIMAGAKTAKDKQTAIKTLDQAYIDYTSKAAEATDPNMRTFYSQMAQDIVNQKTAYINAQAVAKEAGKPDVGAISDLPTRQAPTPRKVEPPSKSGPGWKKNANGEIELD